MRKRIIDQGTPDDAPAAGPWLNVEHVAQVELSSEDPAFPIEAALRSDSATGWRAAHPGAQTIRLVFDAPQHLGQIQLVFDEFDETRTQEFALQWSADGGQSYRPILRQQYTFSPPSTTREVENYTVNLDGVTVLELQIVPNISGGAMHASLASMRLG